MIELDPSLKDFLAESAENLDRLDRDFVTLEQDPRDRARLASVFRTIHTIKGTCGFFGLSKLESVTHVGENLLSRLRDGELLLTPESTTALLAMVDAVRAMLAHIAETGCEGAADYSAIVATLTRLAGLSPAPAATAPCEAPVIAPAVLAPGPAAAPAPAPKAARPSSHDLTAAYREWTSAETKAAGSLAPPAALVAPEPGSPIAASGPRESSDGTEGNVRINISLLDRLMTLVGELVLARNQILQHGAVRKDPTLARPTQRLNLITTELQEGVMKTRMQPIATVWNRLPRIVRDLAAQCGKQVRLEMEGQETELDRTVIEAIKDPLTHIVRNSIDHGIEPVAGRAAAGKPAEGRLVLRAFHEGGQVNIDITDDGRGIDPDRVKAKALERGLIDAAAAARMSQSEATRLVFLPGFSTAEKVSNLSGRGVGMDVVRTNIEKIGVTVDLQSRPGQGTSLRI
ncbi:MAG: chemotaxis protein CheA, partial [Planctomycetes bacterium]|nr:chemotaxis protein CheA [Planctomycetota bacterium]